MMTAWDPSSDLTDIADGLETLTIDQQLGSGLSVAALPGITSTVDAVDGAGRVRQIDKGWSIADTSDNREIAPGTQVTDAQQQNWTVLAVEQQRGATRLTLRARRFVIAAARATRVTIERQLSRPGPHGAVAVSWSPWRKNIPGWFQPLSRAEAAGSGTLSSEETWAVYLEGQWQLGRGYRLVDADGNAFRIVRSEDQQRLDRLVRIIVAPTPT